MFFPLLFVSSFLRSSLMLKTTYILPGNVSTIATVIIIIIIIIIVLFPITAAIATAINVLVFDCRFGMDNLLSSLLSSSACIRNRPCFNTYLICSDPFTNSVPTHMSITFKVILNFSMSFCFVQSKMFSFKISLHLLASHCCWSHFFCNCHHWHWCYLHCCCSFCWYCCFICSAFHHFYILGHYFYHG